MFKLVLILGLMKTLGIEEVDTVNVSNTDGLLEELIEEIHDPSSDVLKTPTPIQNRNNESQPTILLPAL